MAVLEYSKQHMYNFFYNVMKPFYGNRASLVYTDTDSLVLNIQTEDLYKYYHKYKQHLDLDETPGSVITDVVALRPKTYYYDKVEMNTNDVKTDMRAKGISMKSAKTMFLD